MYSPVSGVSAVNPASPAPTRDRAPAMAPAVCVNDTRDRIRHITSTVDYDVPERKQLLRCGPGWVDVDLHLYPAPVLDGFEGVGQRRNVDGSLGRGQSALHSEYLCSSGSPFVRGLERDHAELLLRE